jgi:hypothetical protein
MEKILVENILVKWIFENQVNFFPQKPEFEILKNSKKNFCSTLSEFENFLLCERILINLTTCQNETSS